MHNILGLLNTGLLLTKDFLQSIITNMASLVNKKDLLALYLSGPTVIRPVQDPLAVLLLDNQLYIVEKDNNVMVKFLTKFFLKLIHTHSWLTQPLTHHINLALPTQGVIFFTSLLLYVLELQFSIQNIDGKNKENVGIKMKRQKFMLLNRLSFELLTLPLTMT